MSGKSSSREQRERLAKYRAHQQLHTLQISRRKRDQWLAAIIAIAGITLSSLGYWAYFQWGPGQSDPEELASAVQDIVDDLEEQTAAATSGTAPDPALSESREWTGSLEIGEATLSITLDGEAAPQAVASMVNLINDGFFDDTFCHRLTTEGIYILQCGDPEGTGLGGPDYRFGPIENAPADDVYPAGTLAMARVGNDGESMGSQFFIVWDDSTIPSDAAGGYTVFGEITAGLDQLKSFIVSQGTESGASDGSPVADTTISNITIR